MNELTTQEHIYQLSTELAKLEKDLAVYKQIKKSYDTMKAELFEMMESNDIDKFITENGTQFTKVSGVADTYDEVQVFDEERFKTEHRDMWENYQFTTHEYHAGRKGYVKITMPKGEK